MKRPSSKPPTAKPPTDRVWPKTASDPWLVRKDRPRRRRLTLAVLPTLLTLGNGVCGMAAIAVATSALLDWTNEEQLFVAGLLIFGGMLFDALDGSAARMTGQSSEFGAQLDSLCDAITFGAAPAVLVWRFSNFLPHRISWAIGVIFALCVLIRLARFNVETTEDDSHEGFDGLPSPAAAGTIASFTIAMPHLESLAHGNYRGNYRESIRAAADYALMACEYLVPVLALILAYLMVSRFTYPHIVQQWMRGRRSPNQIGRALFAVGGVIVLHELALPLVFCVYAFSTPIRQWRRTLPATSGSDRVDSKDDAGPLSPSGLVDDAQDGTDHGHEKAV
jgi:CDP-diacylglycerol---serine O-phosphatidyltransferase